MTFEHHTNPSALASELESIDAEIAVYENLAEIADGVSAFSDAVSRYTLDDVEKAFTEDTSLQFELGQLKDALGKISGTFDDYYSKLTDPAGKIGDVGTVTGALNTLTQTVHSVDSQSGPEQLRSMGELLDAVKDVMGLSEALKINPVIGAMLTGYAAAIENAATTLADVAAGREQLHEAINVAGGARPRAEIEAEERIEAARQEAARLEELRQAAGRRIGDLAMRRYEIISNLNEGTMRIIRAHCARQHRALIGEVLEITMPYGGWYDPKTINQDTLESLLDGWVDGMSSRIADAFGKAQRSEGEERQRWVDEAQRLTDAKYDALDKLRPVIDCIRKSAEDHLIGMDGTVGGGRSRRRVAMMGGGGLLAGMMLIGGVLLLGDGADDIDAGSPSTSANVTTSGGESPASSIAADDAPAGDATPRSGGSGIPDAPVVLHPCDLIPAGEVQALTGTAGAGTRALDQERRKVCDYRIEEGESPIVVLEAQRNSASDGFLEEFRQQRADATQIVTLDWGGEGEIRVTESQVSLWSYVIDDDPLGRNLFVWIVITNTPGPGSLVDAVEQLGESLRDELLAGQPAS